MNSQSTHLLPVSLLSTSWKTACRVSGGFALSYGLLGGTATAQIIVDTPNTTLTTTTVVPNSTDVGCTGTCITITGGLRDSNSTGPNVFHSFSEFNISNGQTVRFDSQLGVTNIFSRVTGSSSTIDGSLTVNGPANLFLLNPQGITFTSNARLNIPGSFLASTADSLLFQNGSEFSATSSAVIPSLLNINVPIGLQFGSSVPEAIQVQGSGHALSYNRDFTISRGIPTSGLIATSGQTLALLGGNVSIESGNLASESGHIEVGSIGENSTVAFTPTSSGWDFNYSDTQRFQNINLSQNSSIDVSSNDAGSVQLQGQQININGGSAIIANVLTSGNGQIALNATEQISLTGVNLSAAQRMPTGAYIEIEPTAMGDGNSQISVNTPELSLTAGAQIGLSLAGSGPSGNVDISALNITVDGGSNATPSGLFAAILPSSTDVNGQGGNLNINGGLDANGQPLSANRLSVTDSAIASAETYGAGNAGNLNIHARDIEVIGFGRGPSSLLSASRSSSSGNGGEINIVTERLIVAEGGQVSVATNSTSAAGDINIEASESVELRGAVTQGRSGLFALARINDGAGGNIDINTDQLSLLEGATINASNFSSTASGLPAGSGAAGNIKVVASDITLQDNSLITTDTVAGDRANITLESDSLVLRRGSQITTNANTRTTNGTGSTVVTGSATGGNITINTQALIALENSDITANASNNFGGRIVVTAESILGTAYREELTPESDITASSELGPAFSGSVEINSPDVDPTNGLTQLPEGLAATNQVVAACEQLENNTFVATGRGGLPDNASQLITGESIWNDFRLIENTNHFAEHPNEPATSGNKITDRSTVHAETETSAVVEAQTWSLNHQGDIVLGVYPETLATEIHTQFNCLTKR